MATNAERAAVLVRALEASILGDTSVIPELYTDDVKGWAPALAVGSADELAAALEDREGAFSDIELDVSPFDVADGRACVEWVVTLTHSGSLDGRICSFRQYWDHGELLDQLPHPLPE